MEPVQGDQGRGRRRGAADPGFPLDCCTRLTGRGQQVFSYVGQWAVEEPSVYPGIEGDEGLVIKSKVSLSGYPCARRASWERWRDRLLCAGSSLVELLRAPLRAAERDCRFSGGWTRRWPGWLAQEQHTRYWTEAAPTLLSEVTMLTSLRLSHAGRAPRHLGPVLDPARPHGRHARRAVRSQASEGPRLWWSVHQAPDRL